ncbi:MAG TPA: hypothetical protein VN927_05940, partial [Gemmatimonadaceae bacterium]|nr:hypothetical protein [Gemmatimonadaceae bacterium]
GVIAYELLTGAPPFTGRSAQALLAAHIVQRPADLCERRRDLPRELTRLVMSCLEKDPALRPQRAQAVLETLEAAAPDEFGLVGDRVMEAPPTIAVLPFSNLGGSTDDEYFSDGVTEDIIAQLSQISSLRVISRTSVMRYKKTEKTTREIAGELGVSNIIEGSVRRVGNRLRIVAQLIDPATEGHLWGETFDREMIDIFAIQSEVAERVAGVLRTRLTTDEQRRAARRPTDDVEAYNLFLLGRHHYNAITVDIGGFAKAGEYFQRAIERDPNFGRAYAWQAMVQLYFGGGYWGVRPRDAWARGLSLAAKALELDGDISEAHMVLGQHADWIQYDWETARHHKETALRLSPNDTSAILPYALLLAALGRFDEMVAATHRAVALDPASIMARVNAIFICWASGVYDEALVHARAARTWFVNDPGLPIWEAAVLVGLGRKTDALPLVNGAVDAPLDNLHGLLALAVLAACGDTAGAVSRLAPYHAREATEYVWPFGFAMCYSQLGDTDRALTYLERAYEDRTGWVSLLATAPLFEGVRSNRRFNQILEWVNPPAARMLAAR